VDGHNILTCIYCFPRSCKVAAWSSCPMAYQPTDKIKAWPLAPHFLFLFILVSCYYRSFFHLFCTLLSSFLLICFHFVSIVYSFPCKEKIYRKVSLKIVSTISNENTFSSLHLYTCGQNVYYSLFTLFKHLQLFYRYSMLWAIHFILPKMHIILKMKEFV
jgi:hypothetical protein